LRKETLVGEKIKQSALLGENKALGEENKTLRWGNKLFDE